MLFEPEERLLGAPGESAYRGRNGLALDFWRLSEVDQRRALAALARSGASMAVSDETPPDPARAVGWRQAGSTNYYAYSLSQLLEPVQNSAIPPEFARANVARGEVPLAGTRQRLFN